MRFFYTDEHIEYVKSIAKGRYNDEIAELFNKKFDLNKTPGQINSMKSNHGIKSGKLPRRERPNARLFTNEQEVFLQKIQEGRYSNEVARKVNREFGLSITPDQIKNWRARNKINSGLTGRFKEGMKPWNKGMKGLQMGGKETQFKKGQVPLNYRPVGSERITVDGYIEIKVADPGTWKHKHVVEWEKHNGPVPKNHVIVFADSNKENITLDNLLLISRSELARMNQGDLFFSDPELTKAGLNIVRLNNKIMDVEIYGGDREEFQKYIKIAERRGLKEQTFIARLKRGWSLEDALNRSLHYVPHRRRKGERSVSN